MGLLTNLLRSVDDLVKLGYPESVAERIVSGELPMDVASRMQRAEAQGFDPSNVQYHGTDSDFLEFIDSTDGSLGPGVYVTPESSLASDYANDFLANDVASGAQVMPLLVKGDSIPFKDLLRQNPDAAMSDLYDIGNNYRQSGITSTYGSVRQTAGGDPQKVQAVFDPRDIRSYFSAAFDPEYTGPNILGSAAGTAGALGLLAAPEEAEAGVAKSAIQAAMAGVRTPQDFLSALERLGASPEQAAQIARGELSPSKIGVSSQNASLLPVIDRSGGLIDARFDPRVNSRIRNAELETGILSRGTMDDIPRVALSDLEGQRFVTSMSDRTAAGGLLESINGVNLNNLINLQGGQGFMFENPGMVWASAPNPVNQILTASGGENVFYLPWRMAPSGGDFATKTGETMLSYASANMSKAEKKSLDKLIKDYKTTGTWDKDTQSYKGAGLQISGWKGVDDPSSIEAWRNAPDSLRKELMNAMDVEFRDRGGLSIGEARLAVTDPDQRFAMDGGIQNVGQIFGGQPAIIGSGHPSYPAGVPGQGVGRLDQLDMSIFDLIPDARIGSDQVLVREAVDPTNPNPEALRALQMKPYSGVVTEDILKTLDARGVNVNDLAPYIGGGAALGLMAAPEDAEAGFITRGGRTLLEAFHGSPYQFDRFDMSKIGTGEGAQTYGHGLYFADREDVARGYRDALSDYSGFTTKSGIPIKDSKKYGEWGAYINDLYRQGKSKEEIAKLMRSSADKSLSSPFKQEQARGRRAQKLAAEIESGTVSHKSDGALYRTEIDVTPESLLDWDKPLSEQPKEIRNAAQNYFDLFRKDDYITEYLDPIFNDQYEDMTGKEFYQTLNNLYSEGYLETPIGNKTADDALYAGNIPVATSASLLDDNIRGIQYLDGSSRKAGEGTRNYVIFEDSPINIADRYAIAPPMFAPSQDRALAAANQGLLDPLTVDEQRIAKHNMDVNKQMAKLGLLADPMYEYGNIIPAKTNIVTGETSLAFPAIARDIIGGLLDLANTRRSGVYNPTALMDVAL